MAKGVIKKLSPKDRSYYTAQDVMEIMNVGRSKAYEMIRDLREALESEGLMFRGSKEGTIPKWIFRRAYLLDEVDIGDFVNRFNQKTIRKDGEKCTDMFAQNAEHSWTREKDATARTKKSRRA